MTEDFTKLKVAQLKDRCRELGLTGYSKLKKEELVAKVVACRSHSSTGSGTASGQSGNALALCDPSVAQPALTVASAFPSVIPGEIPLLGHGGLASRATARPSPRPPSPRLLDAPSSTSRPRSKILPDASCLQEDSIQNASCSAPASTSSAPVGRSSFKRSHPPARAAPKPNFAGTSDPAPKRPKLDPPASKARMAPPTPACIVPPSGVRAKKTGFAPLQPSHTQPAAKTPETVPVVHSAAGLLSTATETDVLALTRPITLPPKLKLRQRVKGLALSLLLLEDADRRAFAAAGKLARYSVYASALHLLQQEFPGARTTRFLSIPSIDVSTSNLWPYLLFRRRSFFTASHVPHWLDTASSRLDFAPDGESTGFDGVSKEVFKELEEEGGVKVAMRVVLWKLSVNAAVGGMNAELAGQGQVMSVRRVVNGIWRVTIARRKGVASSPSEMCLVLEATGEPIGRVPDSDTLPSPSTSVSASSLLHLLDCARADWAIFIRSRLLASSTRSLPAPSLFSLVQTPNDEEFPRGIASSWRNGTAEELRAAERFILSLCILQSVSGTAQSICQMHAAWHGLPASDVQGPTTIPSSQETLALLLPSSHHVVSVHFDTRPPSSLVRVPLHSALALVQLEEREHVFALRETGQIVGSWEDGVHAAWQEILVCDQFGVEHIVVAVREGMS